MKVILFYNREQDKRVRIVQRLIEKHGCEVKSFSCDEVWLENKYQNPISFLQDATHFLFIFEGDPLHIPAFVFYSGYAIGKGFPILLLTGEMNIKLPNILNHFVVILGVTSFENYFIKEKKNFETNQQKGLARRALLDKGYPFFETNFALAVQNNDISISKLFLQAGFTADVCDAEGTPLLSLAVRNSYTDIVKLLLQAGANVNQVSKDRHYSALMDAVQIGNYENANILLESGANPNIQSEDGQTALILAVGRKEKELVALLTHYGAKSDIKDKLGMSARKYAEVFNDKEILAILDQ